MRMGQAAARLAVAAANEDGGTTTAAPATTTTVGDHRTAAELRADQATATQLVLTQADLPAGGRRSRRPPRTVPARRTGRSTPRWRRAST